MTRVPVVVRATVPCPVCGYRRPTARFVTVDVLATQLREHGVGLSYLPGDCTECGWRERPGFESLPPRWQLEPKSQAKVDEVHAKKYPHRQRIAS